MSREAWRHKQQNNGSHAAPSRGRRVLSIPNNSKRSWATELWLCNLNEESRVLLADSNSTRQIHASGCWLFLEGWYRTGNIPAISIQPA